jgi:hypothetical protein
MSRGGGPGASSDTGYIAGRPRAKRATPETLQLSQASRQSPEAVSNLTASVTPGRRYCNGTGQR